MLGVPMPLHMVIEMAAARECSVAGLTDAARYPFACLDSMCSCRMERTALPSPPSRLTQACGAVSQGCAMSGSRQPWRC